ncbi:cytochrome d ubiquinol oxidase subunit II [Ktedonosporobacter rubrisoli]|uniref:Cytochrome d ubiquinol oxidase subunit II n=1 Tax=Ktedonosporobacter rubrisoli TaxID=2509675 RepID=A0A4P6JRH9_KTERU|nr:cytochrome d ubiquinol oxidase subunit II [Ktedonosporobacter rubrisoli]QBD77944.1 cytochrome d ubiquinol oxidase subunit II [Ktedonosporobacter rubrisoli]
MPTLWFILVAFMLVVYVVLDGFDLGAGVIHLFVARNDRERRMILRAIGPVWDGNEVWIIAAGGTLFFTFPLLYASSFSGFYLPLIIVLWLLIVRGVSVELRSRIPSPVWSSFWDGLFFIGSALLAIFFGAALGNVMRGVPLHSDGYFFEALWTDFNPYSTDPGILDWYTILIGLMALATLIMHGANYIAVKTTQELQIRSRHVARGAWVATAVLTVLSTIATFLIQHQILASFQARPWGVIFPLLAFIGLIGTFLFNLSGRDLPALFSSGAFIVGMLASSAFGLYPLVLPAVNPAYSLTISNAAGSLYGQTVGLVWWLIGIALAILYFVLTYRLFWGKISEAELNAH